MDDVPSPGLFWTVFGAAGGIIFYGRFYVQWIVTERERRSVIPVSFWYMSCAGSIMLMAYAFASQSPLGALGHSFNIVIYARNLVYIWREQGRLTPWMNRAVHGAVGIIAFVAVGLMLWTWWREYELTSERPRQETQQVWFWLAVGVVGQVLFGGRFVLQWIATEWKGRSVIPKAFWHISVVAATLQASCFIQRAEWIFAAGMLATLLIYGRNIWFIHSKKKADVAG